MTFEHVIPKIVIHHRIIRTFHIVVVHRKSKEQIKTVMHVQSCCFAYTISCF